MLPVEVVFLRMRHQKLAEARIREKAEELAGVYPTLQGCRVVVDVPNRHVREGRRFHVRVEMAVPRHTDLVVERGPSGRTTPSDDDRPMRHKANEIDGAFTDLATVIHDVFAAAKRRLTTLRQRTRTTARGGATSGRRTSPARARKVAAD